VHLTIIIPAHNEQHRIDATLAQYRRACEGIDTTITVALDDCTDDTAALVGAHHDADPRVEAIAYPRLGKGGVLTEAIRHADADYIAFVDADGATPPEELIRLVDACEHTQSDIAIASRYHPASVLPAGRSRTRRLTSRCFAALVRRMFGLPYADTQCGAKVLRRAAAERMTPLLTTRDFVFDVDLLATARALNYTVAEVPTVWIDRTGSRVSTGRDSMRMAGSLFVLWLRNHVVPVMLPSAEVVAFDPAEPARPARTPRAA
jgi:glycosyltransferase involved in cell wall biosynthesis